MKKLTVGIVVLVLAITQPGVAAKAKSPQNQPNILLIVVDDTGKHLKIC